HACSGDMYPGVPITVPRPVTTEFCLDPFARLGLALSGVVPSGSHGADIIFASPQSITRISPKGPTITFAGLRSRCRTLRVCAQAPASQMRRKMRRRSGMEEVEERDSKG